MPAAATSTEHVSRFTTWILGADVFVRATPHLRIAAGARAEPMTLDANLTGRAVRVLAGLVWNR